jgi:branched-chain amino acid aminotransferase
MPVSSVDGVLIGDGHPGPITRQITSLYWDMHKNPGWTTPVAYRG